MNRAALSAGCTLLALSSAAFGRGVSPYLPLNLEPEIERQIERVLILAGKPIMTRPIAAATVLAALPRACKKDMVLCTRVRGYLTRYTHTFGIARASAEGSVTHGANITVPNSYGLHSDSSWDVSAQAFWQPADHLLVDLGGVVYQGSTKPDGTVISLGFSYAQLDIGWRPHWFSPMSDSSMLMSSEAPTMPSVTLSNYEPISRFGFHYELFAARMSNSDHIEFHNGFTSGHPRLAGVHLSLEPASGWSLGVNRLMQYGGGARGGSLRDLFKAFFNPSGFDNTSATLSTDQQVGNQEASVTSSLLFPGKVPFAVYAEYAGEDTSRGRNYLLGNTALSVGIHFPSLWKKLDLTVEVSEWQNEWYTHGVYQDGLTNDGRVVGAWFGDQRVFNDGVGGKSGMVRLGWEPPFGGLLQVRYRVLENESYSGNPYRPFRDLTLGYSRSWQSAIYGAELDSGQDVFGKSFTRLSGFIRYDEGGLLQTIADTLTDEEEQPEDKQGEVFVDAGAVSYTLLTDVTGDASRHTTPRKASPHLAVGARRFVSEHSDLGTRVEFDDIDGHSLVGIRLLDYRYHYRGPLALGAFVGAARYNLATPAYGFYYGLGLQWRNLLRNLDVGAELRYDDNIARDHLLPSDPHVQRPDSFYDVTSLIVSASYHF